MKTRWIAALAVAASVLCGCAAIDRGTVNTFGGGALGDAMAGTGGGLAGAGAGASLGNRAPRR